MAEFRWIKMFLFLILELQITAVTGQLSSVIVRDGDDVTLLCESVTANQDECDNTNWIFSGSERNTVDLVKRGQIHENTKVKADRLSVTASCSLVIKNVTSEDVGVYYCQQHISGQVAQVVLSVINMNERDDGQQVTLFCSVRTHDSCLHTVKWLYEGKDVDEHNKDVEVSQYGCYGTVTFSTSHLELKPTYREVFQCKATDGYTKKEQRFNFSLQPSGDDTATSKTEVTMRTTENSHKTSHTPEVWWWYIVVAVGLAALLIIVVVVIRWKKTTRNKTQTDQDTRQSLNPAVTQSAPGTSQDTADPEDGVSYVSVSYTKKSNSKARVRVEDDADDEGDAVTYSTVKASSSSAGASADPSNVYATVN